MDWPSNGTGAHAAYHENDRCPICFVPAGAPHLDSCDYSGSWDGSTGRDWDEWDEEDWDDD